ncbi:hypothetical protein [Leptospira kirschneri]|uniref:hypothetical protein n=1 Tax=Leptospira kirschneri TaxID=29507 RepID=UPI0021004FE8|nr:hypothetical protein [Leptospira kirschneri]
MLLPFLFFTINSCSRIWSIGILNQKNKTVTLILKLQIQVSQNHFQSWITGHHSENLNLPSIDFRNWFRVRSESIAYSNRSKFEEKIQLENIQYNRVVENSIVKIRKIASIVHSIQYKQIKN